MRQRGAGRGPQVGRCSRTSVVRVLWRSCASVGGVLEESSVNFWCPQMSQALQNFVSFHLLHDILPLLVTAVVLSSLRRAVSLLAGRWGLGGIRSKWSLSLCPAPSVHHCCGPRPAGRWPCYVRQDVTRQGGHSWQWKTWLCLTAACWAAAPGGFPGAPLPPSVPPGPEEKKGCRESREPQTEAAPCRRQLRALASGHSEV